MFNRNSGYWRQVIQAGTETGALREARESVQKQLSSAISSSSSVVTVEDALNEMHDALIDRALMLAENEMARQGLGSPPVPYAYILFGSGGRREQTFSSDQDSGIVYANPPSDEAAAQCRRFFPKLADIAVQNLIELGYPPCDGNVVASNPEWCLPLAQWDAKIDRWCAEPSWEHVRYLLIVADGRPVAGDVKLAYLMKNELFKETLQGPAIVRRMLDNTLRYKVLVGIFGQLLPERYGANAGTLDIKYGGYIPMVNVFRLMAIQAGIRETSTLGRISALQDAGILAPRTAEQAVSAFTLFLSLRLLTRGIIPKDQLTNEMASRLRKSLKFGREMQRRVEREMDDRFKGR